MKTEINCKKEVTKIQIKLLYLFLIDPTEPKFMTKNLVTHKNDYIDVMNPPVLSAVEL